MIQINMEKPNHCLHCPMRNGDDECVLIQEIDTSWDWEEQYANCPLQEVETERKKGKWIWFSSTYDSTSYVCTYRCSNCYYFVMTNGDKPCQSVCPNCGANMKEGGESEID